MIDSEPSLSAAVAGVDSMICLAHPRVKTMLETSREEIREWLESYFKELGLLSPDSVAYKDNAYFNEGLGLESFNVEVIQEGSDTKRLLLGDVKSPTIGVVMAGLLPDRTYAKKGLYTFDVASGCTEIITSLDPSGYRYYSLHVGKFFSQHGINRKTPVPKPLQSGEWVVVSHPDQVLISLEMSNSVSPKGEGRVVSGNIEGVYACRYVTQSSLSSFGRAPI